MEPALAGLILVCLLVLVLSSGMPIPLGMMAVAAFGFLFLVPRAQMSVIGSEVWGSVADPIIGAVPLFIFMGELFARGRLKDRTFDGLTPLMERLPGGLLQSNVASTTLFAAASGSGVGTAAAMGSMMIPELHGRGYPRRMTYGTLAAGGTLGILIPPSLGMIIYAILTGTSIGQLFIAGIIPGLLMAGCFMLFVAFYALRFPERIPTGSVLPFWQTIRKSGHLLPLVLLIGFVITSLYAGIATPSEAGAVGVLGMFVLPLLYRVYDWPSVREAAAATVRVTVMLLSIMFAASLLTYLVAYMGLPQMLSTGIVNAPVPTPVLLVLLTALLLSMGALMDEISVMVLAIPVVYPAMMALGFDPIWFGIFFTIIIQLGAISPPIGINLFVLMGIDPTAQWRDLVMGILPFIAIQLLVIAIIYVFPELVTWLPTQLR